jgi:hypothetical protein
MEQKKLWMLHLLVAVSMLLLTACKDSDNSPTPAPKGADGYIVNPNPQWKNCEKAVYFGGLAQESDAFKQVLDARFPNQTPVGEADIAFVSPSEAMALASELKALYDRGGLIVVMRPTETNYYSLPDEIEDEDFTDNADMDELFFAFNLFEQHYTMIAEPEFEGYDAFAAVPDDRDQMKASDDYGLTNPPENYELPVYDVDDETDQNENYWHHRITPFINWIEEMDELQQERLSASASRRAADEIPDYQKLKVNINSEGQLFETDFGFSLNNYITSGVSEKWYLNASSLISVRYTIYPVYLLECNGNDKAGDYYIVTGKVTPHNNEMWMPVEKEGGLFNWGRCRIYGYWFKEMDVAFDLLDDNGQMAEGLRYHQTPIPENENDKVDYSKGFSAKINGALAGGAEGKFAAPGSMEAKWKAELKFGFEVGWESKTNYSLKTVAYQRSTATSTVKYHYYTNNVKLTDNGIGNYDSNFPAACRSEFEGKNVWVWHVPAGKAGVKDNSEKSFTMRVKAKATYSTWYHWRAAKEFDSNRKDFSTQDFSYSQKLKPLNRQPFGVIALKNASYNTVRNIKIFNNGDVNGKEVATISSTYEYNQIATANVPEGTYSLTFEYIDPNQGNKVVGNGTLHNIKVKPGATPKAATTEVSTGDADIKL